MAPHFALIKYKGIRLITFQTLLQYTSSVVIITNYNSLNKSLTPHGSATVDDILGREFRLRKDDIRFDDDGPRPV